MIPDPFGDEDILDLSLGEAAQLVRTRELSSRQLVEASFRRIRKSDHILNTAIWLREEESLLAAQSADEKAARGEWMGPLHGLPLAHKDVFSQIGRPCTYGSKVPRDLGSETTATVISRLEEAGSITVGGLNMAPFGLNPTGHNSDFGECRNPWEPRYITGGSSSGSGAAVCARFVYGSVGSDTGGSIRLPSAACGLTGLKGTQGRVSRFGMMQHSASLDNAGPIARSAKDCAILMSVIAGYDIRDPSSARFAVPQFEAELDRSIQGMRVGLPKNYFLEGVDEKISNNFYAALEVLVSRGAEIFDIDIPHMDEISSFVSIILRCESGAVHASLMRDHMQEYPAEASSILYTAYAIPAVSYLGALRCRGPILQSFTGQVFSKVDVVIAPTIRTALPTLAETDFEIDPGGAGEWRASLAHNTSPINYLGLPAINVPCGFDGHGLPTGLQIIGRPYSETRLLRIAYAYQGDTAWHKAVPNLDRTIIGTAECSHSAVPRARLSSMSSAATGSDPFCSSPRKPRPREAT